MSTSPTSSGTVLTVGLGQEYSTIAAAVNAAQSGDTIDVQAGTYTNDFIDTSKSLTLQAVGGVVTMVETQSPPDGKAMITEGGDGVNFTINGFDISGVTVPDGNGAAVRYQGGNLTLNNDYFHNNQDGIMGNPSTPGQGTVTIESSEFAYNGTGDGQTHNIYIGDVQQLTLDNVYSHDAVVGHEVKSRAENTTITNSRILDNSGSASYSIDLPNGGNATITNDVIEQGPNTQNSIIISYGEEGNLHAGTSVQITNDTIINDKTGSALGIKNTSSYPITVSSDQVYGLTGTNLTSGPANVSGITYLTSEPTLDTTSSWQPSGSSTSTPTPTPTHSHNGHTHQKLSTQASTLTAPSSSSTPVTTTTRTPAPVTTTPTPTPVPITPTTPAPTSAQDTTATPTPTSAPSTRPTSASGETVHPANFTNLKNVSGGAIQASADDHMLFIGGIEDAAKPTGLKEAQGGRALGIGAGNDTALFAAPGATANAAWDTRTVANAGLDNMPIVPGSGERLDNAFGHTAHGASSKIAGLYGMSGVSMPPLLIHGTI